MASALERANNDLQTATLWLMQNGLSNPNNAGAAAYPYMTLMGIVCLGLMWLRMARASAAALANGTDNADFHQTKLATARFFADRIMPADQRRAPQDRGRRGQHHGAAGGGVLTNVAQRSAAMKNRRVRD